jgi:hypothetical protein
VKNRPIKEQRLDALEEDFRPLLLACLVKCADGRYGLFGQNDGPELARYYQWDEAERVKEMAREIRTCRAEFGQPNTLAERFLYYSSFAWVECSR